ncbi:uncharacterized protein LOC110709337 isoform X1 [Chenopodium quinoa]|uniref:uncharacterized protein LOC110709337 isoform X1 n=1 Tax=Chenopodium quinoa TaxID=63459 RepID=UPI000B76F261|nr:uncharacterized protein LOC110709337 isoform X1 [Chenopodium quinoa]
MLLRSRRCYSKLLLNVRLIANKRKQICSSQEAATRENHRGRTVRAAVGRPIQSGNKIPLQWNHKKLPCGDHKTDFSTYIGVVVCIRVSINYKEWEEVPKEVINEVLDFITKGFTVPEDCKGYVIKQASKRWRAFKARLRKYFMYECDEEGNTTDVIIWTPPSLYPWITVDDWKKFVETSLDDKFKELSELNRKRAKKRKTSYRGGRKGYSYYEDESAKELQNQGIQVVDVPRHLVWIRAHSREEGGVLKFDNLANLEIAQAIANIYKFQKELEAQHNQGEIDASGRNDILARALNTPEHGGCVRAVGGVTNKEYFGYKKPTPANQVQSELKQVETKLENVTNNQNFLMSFIMSNFQLTPEQFQQIQLGSSSAQFGGFGVNKDVYSATFGELLSSHGLDGSGDRQIVGELRKN